MALIGINKKAEIKQQAFGLCLLFYSTPPKMTSRFFDPQTRRASLWLLAFALVGVALTLLYRDAEQQDSGFHFLFARWAGVHPTIFVGVWARPLFTLVYWLPSQFGHQAAKLFTVLITLATAWQTFRLAQQINFNRAELALPLLFLQPALFALSPTVMTEPLFALLFVIALRLHLAGRIRAGMVVASLLVLIRPEGFFIGALWGVWVLFGYGSVSASNLSLSQQAPQEAAGRSRSLFRTSLFRLKPFLEILLLASGMAAWWLAAYLMTGDKLWIVHDWPTNWQITSQAYGTGPIWWYAALMPLIVSLPLLGVFLAGLFRLAWRREFVEGVSAFLVLFILHSLMYTRGLFGSAGYARYLICVSPAIALITLAGWNWLADLGAKIFAPLKLATAALALGASALTCFLYVDSIGFTRDARGVEWMHDWLRSNRPELAEAKSNRVSRLVCSQAYARILLDRDPWEDPGFNGNRDHNLEVIRQFPAGTLVLWDSDTGPNWFNLRVEDFQAAGYELLKSQEFNLEGWLGLKNWTGQLPKHWGATRYQHMHLLYKSAEHP